MFREILRYRFEQGLGHKSDRGSGWSCAIDGARDAFGVRPLRSYRGRWVTDVSDAVLERRLPLQGSRGRRRVIVGALSRTGRRSTARLKRKHMTLADPLWTNTSAVIGGLSLPVASVTSTRGLAMKLPVTMRQDHAPATSCSSTTPATRSRVVVDRLSGQDTAGAPVRWRFWEHPAFHMRKARGARTLPDWIECHISGAGVLLAVAPGLLGSRQMPR